VLFKFSESLARGCIDAAEATVTPESNAAVITAIVVRVFIRVPPTFVREQSPFN
jgi:hypothetical protein